MTVWLSDFDVAKMTSRVPHPYSEGDAEAFLALGEAYCFVIQRKSDGLFMGMTGFHVEGGYEFGYWLGKPFWGFGYATEAAQRLVSHAFDGLDQDSVHAGWFYDNPLQAACWPSWARAIMARRCGIAGRGDGLSCAMTCC
jgi:RimJ/RimL family protein N-acetyltransferase